MPKQIKKFIFPGATLAFSLYFSFLFALGLVVGYFSTHFFHKKITKYKKLQSINIPLFYWKLHFHHWLMGGVGILLMQLFGILRLMPNVCVGMAAGLMFHDFYSDKDWYKIIIRK